MTKKSNLSSPDSFFQAQNAPKSVFGLATDPAGGAYDVPPDPLVGCGDTPSPFPSQLDAFGVSTAPRFSGPLNTKSIVVSTQQPGIELPSQRELDV